MRYFRYASEKWRVDDVSIEGLKQQAASISTAIQISERNRILLAAYLGRSERHRESQVVEDGASRTLVDQNATNPVSGYQVDIGFDSAIAKGLIVQFGISHEERTQEDKDGDEVGGSVNEGGSQNNLQRTIND